MEKTLIETFGSRKNKEKEEAAINIWDAMRKSQIEDGVAYFDLTAFIRKEKENGY